MLHNPTLLILSTGKCFLHSIIFYIQHIFLVSKNALNFENKNPELKIIYFGKINPEWLLSFGNKILEKIKILFWTKKLELKNNTFWKKKSGKKIVVFQKWKSGNKNEKSIPDKKIRNIKFRSGKKKFRIHILEIFFKDSFVFSVESGGCRKQLPFLQWWKLEFRSAIYLFKMTTFAASFLFLFQNFDFSNLLRFYYLN